MIYSSEGNENGRNYAWSRIQPHISCHSRTSVLTIRLSRLRDAITLSTRSQYAYVSECKVRLYTRCHVICGYIIYTNLLTQWNPFCFIHGLFTLSMPDKFQNLLSMLSGFVCGLFSWFVNNLRVHLSQNYLGVSSSIFTILEGNMSTQRNRLMATFTIGSWSMAICFMRMLFVCFNGFYVSGCARLFIPDVCCHSYDVSVIASHSRSAIVFIGAPFLVVPLAAL